MFEGRPIFLSWLKIAKTPMAKWMWLASDKAKAHNDMATSLWRKKLLRIKKICEGRKIAWINQMPMPL